MGKTVTDQDIVFLVPDSFRVTIRNCNNINADLKEDTIKKRLERRLFLLFLDNLAAIMVVSTLEGKLLENIKCICTSLRNRTKRHDFLPVSKARTNKFYIFRQCTYIVYI